MLFRNGTAKLNKTGVVFDSEGRGAPRPAYVRCSSAPAKISLSAFHFPSSTLSRELRKIDMSDALINGLAGAGGGIIAQLITYPLQTVNTRQQTERDEKKVKRKHGTLEQMCQNEGWGRLYSGLAPSIVGTACSQGVYYYFYQIFRDRAEAIARENKRNGIGDGSVGMLSSLVVAALSGSYLCPTSIVFILRSNFVKVYKCAVDEPHMGSCYAYADSYEELKEVSAQVTHPLPQMKKALDSLECPPYGTSHVIQELYDEAGIWGFWKGVFPTLIMVSNPSMQFMLYETMLKKLKRKRALVKQGDTGVTALEVFLLGALAKLGATVVTYPLLVVKSRLQAKQSTTGDKRHHYEGTLDAILKMIRYEGLHGFYKGHEHENCTKCSCSCCFVHDQGRTCQGCSNVAH
ncbi:PEROXISOMAL NICOTINAMIDE ADENINE DINUCLEOTIDE CARRIER [Salix purpurea]|uniref:PEROXISOMAL NICOTINAMIDE ADENINE DINUCLEOTIDE CARRIER n=1 Tax=Salix purpurea TaxID=77065 RepID=A0A9Q0TUG7_SALPP|nr:PEROXISOMAL NICOTINAMIDE ADENINE DINUCLEOTIDE CARRIER [Salix purpurea]